MILGIGVDLVSVARVAEALDRRPRLRERIFQPEELGGADAEGEVRSLAGRFAAKEALRKALGGNGGGQLRDAVVLGGRGQPPRLELRGGWRAAADAMGATSWHLSITHEREYAVAMVVIER